MSRRDAEKSEKMYKIALAGNPNVGKSTVFNGLTGMHQHTGNWSGKTVANAFGYCRLKNEKYYIADIPGTYSYSARSREEEVARDYICFEENDAVVVVCDATCLEKNMNLVLQTLEITEKVVICINLMDEGRKKGIEVDAKALERLLGVSVVKTEARHGIGLKELLLAVKERENTDVFKLKYSEEIESYIRKIEERLEAIGDFPSKRFLAIRLLCEDKGFADSIERKCGVRPDEDEEIKKTIALAKAALCGKEPEDEVAETNVREAENICRAVLSGKGKGYGKKDRCLDKVFTGKLGGTFTMLLFLLGIFWITIEGANFVSDYLSVFLGGFEKIFEGFLTKARVPSYVVLPLTEGVWRILAWVVSVMLPPMAIFFPLFTLLEDFGYLPRIAFNMDGAFKRCSACGKQSLTMCMGFGCNAVGVTGCRIIDSPRERLLAMITNSFVPCNGRFPAFIALIAVFFAGMSGKASSMTSALFLTGIIFVGVLVTFIASKLLSVTILRGVPSSFVLELPPYRVPQAGKVIIRSVFDRTLFVLGRAVKVATPAGLIIWGLANVDIGGQSVLHILAEFINPLGKMLGLDGVILLAFILSLPANEILLPLIVMAYASNGTLAEVESLHSLAEILKANGWDWIRAVCVMLFSLMHWPCATTLMTIKKESGSMKWTVVAFILPTLFGITACFLFNFIARLFV